MFKSIKIGLSKNFFLVFLIILISLFQLTPLLYENYKAIIIGLWMLAIVYFVGADKKKASSELRKMCIWGGIYIGIGFAYSILGISDGQIVRNMLFSLFVFPMFLLTLMDCKLSKYNARLLFHIIAFIAAVNILENIRLSYIYPYIALMSEEILAEQGLSGLNAGGSSFIAMSVFYLAIMMIAYFNSTKKGEKIVLLIYASIAAWFVVFCSYKASSILFAIITVSAVVILDKVKNVKTAFVILLMIGLAFLILKDIIIHTLVNVIDDPRVGGRLLVFADEDFGEAHDNSLNSRMDFWLVSLRTWIATPMNFIFGIGDHYRSFTSNTAESGIGNHSEFLDVLAKYGMIGGLIIYKILKLLFDYTKKMASGRLYLKVLIFFLLIVMFGFTKKIILPSISIMFFILFPLCLYNINGNERRRKYS